MRRTWGKRFAGTSGSPALIGLGVLAAGSALAYLGGSERSARLRRRALRFTRELSWAVGIAVQDLEQRAYGLWAGACAWWDDAVASASASPRSLRG